MFNVWCVGKWMVLCEKICDIIRVWLNIFLIKDILKSYFENIQKLGGGYIVFLIIIKGIELKVEDVFIIFVELKCIFIFYIL